MMAEDTFVPVDNAARDRARTALDVSMLLEAGAGTGKTSVLIDRVFNILKTEIPLDRIAIITFTEKAAGELKMRLRARMEEMIAAPGPPSWRAHLTHSLEALDRSNISTIHAFCAALLRERPVEAQIDPRFVVADELAARMLLEECWTRWIEKELNAGTEILARALRLGVTLRQLRPLAFAIVQHRDIPAEPGPETFPDLEGIRAAVVAAIREAVELSAHCANPGDKALDFIRGLQKRLHEIESATGDDLLTVLASLRLRCNVGVKANWNPEGALATLKDRMAVTMARVDEATAAARTSVAHALQKWLRDGFLHHYRLAKEGRRVLDFTDLILICRNMLRDDTAARSAFQERFACILVDEFQDTDPLQAEIVFLLASDDVKQNQWQQCRPAPGKLFLVGDPKQSIYRFRRADIEIYEQVKGLLAQPGATDGRGLTQNFRSVPSILSWINDLFENVMNPQPPVAWQPRYEGIAPARGRPESGPTATEAAALRVVFVTPREPASLAWATAGAVRLDEARHVAALVRKAVSEQWPLRGDDRSDKSKGRPMRYDDIALLFNAGTAFETYEEVLRGLGIPYRISGGRRYYQRAEIRALEAVLHAIESPHDPLAVVSAMRCPFFGHSDEELVGHAGARRSWVYLDEMAGRGTPFERDFALLGALHRRRNARSVAATLEDLFEQTGALSLFYLKPDGEQRAANLLKAIDFARTHETIGGTTFGSFVRWLSDMATEEREEGEAPLSEEADMEAQDKAADAVRISTVHKAKGLEFPMVILCDPAGRPRATSPAVIIERTVDSRTEIAGSRMEFYLGAGDRRYLSAGYEQAEEREKQRLEAEGLRLLYVAATRARDYLVIPAFAGKSPAGVIRILAGAGFLPDPADPAAAEQHRGARVLKGAQLEMGIEDAPPLKILAKEALPHDKAFVLEKEGWKRALKEALGAPATGRAFRTASALEETEAPRRLPARAVRAIESAKDIGTAVHAVLERIDLATGRHIGLLSEEEADRIGHPDRAAEIQDLVGRTLRSEIVKEALASPRYERELPFAAAGDSWITEGRADLVFEEGGGLTIVDFKTDKVSTKEEIDARMEAYRPQALLYARALHQVTELPIRRVVLHFIRPGTQRAFKVDEAFLSAGRTLLERGSLEAERGSATEA